MRPIAIAARVSSDRQREEQTIESQISEIEVWAKEHDCLIVERYIDDGWSGDILARPELDRLRDDAGKGVWEAVVWLDRDRLARRYAYQEIVLEELQEKGAEVIFLHQAKAETPEDKILQGFQGLFAEYERVKIVERMRRGKLYKARMGKYMNQQAPYGYTYIPKTKDSDPFLEIKEEEAEVVRKIFHWIADNRLTIRAVIKTLNELKIYPRKRKRDVWSNGPICRMLRSEVYIGKAHFNKSIATVPEKPKSIERYKKVKKSSRKARPKEEWVPLNVPVIISEELFYKVQDQLAQNFKFSSRNRKAPFLLTSIVYCVCGRRRTGEGVRQHRYYRCCDRINRFPLPRECKASGVNAFHLDAMVWDKVSGLLVNPQLIKQQAEEWNQKHIESKKFSEVDTEKLENTLKKLDEEEKRYIKIYGSGLINLDQFRSQMTSIKERKERIEFDLRRANEFSLKPVFDLCSVDGLTQKVAGVIQSLTLDEKRVLLQKVLQSVTVGDSNKVLIKGVIPLESEAQNNGLWSTGRNCWVAECWEIYIV